MIMYIYAGHNFVILSSDSPVKWFDDLVGVAYRYYDLRMNVVPLFNDFKEAQTFWRETIKWWNDHSIKIRFVEVGNTYWFVMGAESIRVENNRFLFKVLPISAHYERFKKGHEGTAYLRLGVYTKNTKKMSKTMQNVIAVISKRIMLKKKMTTAAFSRTVTAKNLKPFR